MEIRSGGREKPGFLRNSGPGLRDFGQNFGEHRAGHLPALNHGAPQQRPDGNFSGIVEPLKNGFKIRLTQNVRAGGVDKDASQPGGF